jgi:hypothetical protein
MAIKGIGFPDAARLLEGIVGKSGFPPTGKPNGADSRGHVPGDPLRSWREGSPIVPRSPAALYLKARGLILSPVEARSLRCHPSLWHWPTRERWPALAALVALCDRTEIAAHQTFLEWDGSAKAPLGDKARLFPRGAHLAGAGVWFGNASPDREFLVAEGIESTLSAMRIYGLEAGVAALSEGGIRRLILPAEARAVRIFADHDRLGQGIAAARDACKRWRAEGREVSIVQSPRVGLDANDVWLGRLKREVSSPDETGSRASGRSAS